MSCTRSAVNEWLDRKDNGGELDMFETVDALQTDHPLVNDSTYDKVLHEEAEKAYDAIDMDGLIDQAYDKWIDNHKAPNGKKEQVYFTMQAFSRNPHFRERMINDIYSDYDGDGGMYVDTNKIVDNLYARG